MQNGSAAASDSRMARRAHARALERSQCNLHAVQCPHVEDRGCYQRTTARVLLHGLRLCAVAHIPFGFERPRNTAARCTVVAQSEIRTWSANIIDRSL
jgi:hypothetical protein